MTPKPREVEVKTVPVRIPIAHPTMPRAVDLKEPQWYVVSDKNLEDFMVKIEKEAGSVVFFAMTPDDYELMAYNMQELRRYIREVNQVVVYYYKITSDKPEQKPGEEKGQEKAESTPGN